MITTVWPHFRHLCAVDTPVFVLKVVIIELFKATLLGVPDILEQ